jgi:hypothetical protein
VNPLKLGTISISRDVVAHPLLGDAHVIEHAGRAITAMSALDWERPQHIPVVAAPARLPPGAGGALLNEIARRAREAGIGALRYSGPYNTPALYRALLRSFRASAGEDEFTADVLGRALRLARDEVAVDFAPAPHERLELACGHVETRDGIEAAVIAGTRFEREGAVARLVDNACEVWFGDACYARIATLSPNGELVDGPHAPPALASRVLGATFPVELRAALAELVADAVPAPLAADARSAVAARTIAWADLGTRAARRSDAGFDVHAALWERISPFGLARLALAITEALAPVVTSTLLAELTAG